MNRSLARSWAGMTILALLVGGAADAPSSKNAETRARVSQEDWGRASLAGLKNFIVDVGPFSWKEDSGLPNQRTVETDVELRLRRNGLPARFREQSGGYSATEEDIRLGGPARLHVTVEFSDWLPVDRSAILHAYVWVELTQRVFLARDPSINTPAITWTIGGVCLCRRDDMRNVRDAIADMVDRFCNDYLAANPRVSAGERRLDDY